MRWGFLVTLVTLEVGSVAAQTPRPFPTPARPDAAIAASEQKPPSPVVPEAASTAPSDVTLGLPIFPNAQFLASYDAGLGQRYYLFGAQASFTEIVTYYRTALKLKGELVFEQPPTYMFEVGRFRDEIMAFPPGVTVKDFTGSRSEGYGNPKRGALPKSFPTVIQIVPAPAGAGR